MSEGGGGGGGGGGGERERESEVSRQHAVLKRSPNVATYMYMP